MNCEHSENNIIVVCTADKNYVMPLAVMVKSVLTNLSPAYSVILYVIDSGIQKEDKARLIQSWKTCRLTVQWVSLDSSLVSNMPLWGRMKSNTYYKFFMPDFLPCSFQKAIWLDSDLIVIGDLAEIWEMEIGNHSVLAAQDLVVPYVSSRYGVSCYRELGLAKDTKYFNAGVMVINLRWCRKNKVTEKVLDYLNKYRRSVYLWDQDALNAVLANTWGDLDSRWNQIESVSGRSFFTCKHLDPDTYKNVVENPRVIHFSGTFKPWLCRNDNPSYKLYFRYLDMTDWAGWRPKKTLRSITSGVYESKLRKFLYPVEKWYILISRYWSFRKQSF